MENDWAPHGFVAVACKVNRDQLDECFKRGVSSCDKYPKKHYCLIMAAKCGMVTMCKRTFEQVQTKIGAMEDSWRACHDWINNTTQNWNHT